MPAIRTARPDVVLRVPRAIYVAKAKEVEGGSNQDSLTHSGADIAGNSNASHARSGTLDVAGPSTYRRSASPVKGGRISAAHDVEARESGVGSQRAAAVDEATTAAATSSYKYAAQATSTAEWNSLLIWARGQRGPQWDSATGMWQVDQGSNEYYAFANDPARHTNLSNNRRSGGGMHDVDGGTGGGGAEGSSTAPLDVDRKPFAPVATGTVFGVGLQGSALSVAGDANSEQGGAFRSATPSAGFGASSGAAPYSEDSPPVGPGGRRSRAR